MIEIKYETLVSLMPVAVLFFLIFMFFFIKRNSLVRALEGIAYFVYLMVIILFLVVGYRITILAIEQRQYIGLIVPLGWFCICYQGIKQILFITFGISIRKLIDLKSLFNIDSKTASDILTVVFLTFMSLGFLFFTIMIFFVAVPDVAKQPYGMFPLIIAGSIFLLATIILFYLLYKVVTKNILHRVASPVKDQTTVIKQPLNIEKIILRIWLLFAFLFIILFAYLTLVGKSSN